MDAGWPCNIVSSHCIYNYGIDLVLSEYQTNKHKQECHKLYFIYFFKVIPLFDIWHVLNYIIRENMS